MITEEEKYQRALKRIKDIKSFYRHLVVYIVINTFLQLFYSGVFDGGQYSWWMGESPWYARFLGLIGWGIGLLIHGLWVFRGDGYSSRYKKWEEKKIKKIMEEDQKNFQKWN